VFNGSVKPVSAAIQEIADSIGASGDTEMCNRAGRSLAQAIEHFSNRADWEYLLTEADPIQVLGQFSVGGVSASALQTSAAVPVGHGILVDDVIAGPGFVAGLRVSATAAGAINFPVGFVTTAAGINVVTATVSRDFYPVPSNFRKVYSLRMYGSMSTLRPIRRRFYDRSIVNEFNVTTPVGYDTSQIATKGKIRLLPFPAASDVAQLRYYRRMSVATATAATETLDIPQDFEPYFIGWAKGSFLMDKGEGRSEQGATWFAFANDGMKQMIADQTRVPDEDLMFQPGAFTFNPAWGPNSVRGQLDNYWG
jgi:hypothetical protein